MPRNLHYCQALDALSNGHTVVTGSQRLARELALEYADRRSALAGAWERPAVLPWSEWVRELWHQLRWQSGVAGNQRLLSQGRKLLLWEQIIRSAESAGGLVRVHALAQAACEAWDLARGWQLQLSELHAHASEDSRRWLDWAAAYESRCHADGWLDEAELPRRLVENLGKLPEGQLPENLLLIGFDEFSPAQQTLLAGLADLGIAVIEARPPSAEGAPRVRQAADADSELAAAARWSLDLLAADSAATVGIVVPDLAERQETVQRILAETLEPGDSERPAGAETPVFAVSAGSPLAIQPLVAAALNLLNLIAEPTAWNQVSQLLRSPYLGEARQEASARALLDVQLRKRGSIRWPLDWLIKQLEASDELAKSAHCPALLHRLVEVRSLHRSWPRRQSARNWVTSISDLLKALGWPGERTLDSEDYQAQERWRGLLEEIASLDDLLGPVRFTDFLHLLQRAAARTVFKAESGRTPVLAVGVLEAAGLEFDHLWICGLHDEAWPPAPSPTPFLPYEIQRSHRLPRGSAARELAFASAQLERLVVSAREVTISYPRNRGDEELRPSPLLARFEQGPPIDHQREALFGRALDIFSQRPELEMLADGEAPPIAAGGKVRGGARLLELQAQCPFRAFAELRLDAEVLEQPVAGLDARQRGELAHKALQNIWQVLNDSEGLAGCDKAARQSLVKTAIDKAAGKLSGLDDALRRASLNIEQTRLQNLLEQLLDLENSRAPFRVASNERRYRADLAGLSLGVRPDRVDAVASGHLVLDYKTGQVKPSAWFGRRPAAPQLPLYATGLGFEAVRGVAFVQLRAGDVKFAGICADPADMPEGVKPLSNLQKNRQEVTDWQELLRSWQQNLLRLAEEFKQGVSMVDPLADACTWCHLAALCRLEEKKRSGEVASDD